MSATGKRQDGQQSAEKLSDAYREAVAAVVEYLADELEHDEQDPQDNHIAAHVQTLRLLLAATAPNRVPVDADLQEAIKTRLSTRYGSYVLAATAGLSRQSIYMLAKDGATARADVIERLREELDLTQEGER